MKRVLLGLIVGALVFGVAFAGAKVATVTNPMSSDLDGGTHAIFNVNDLQTLYGDVIGGGMVQTGQVQLFGTGANSNIVVGQLDPSLDCPYEPPGSLYLREDGGLSGSGQLWLKNTAALDMCGWVKVAG